MTFAFALHVLVGLSPVLGFLAALVFLDSYKLVAMRTVVLVVLLKRRDDHYGADDE